MRAFCLSSWTLVYGRLCPRWTTQFDGGWSHMLPILAGLWLLGVSLGMDCFLHPLSEERTWKG